MITLQSTNAHNTLQQSECLGVEGSPESLEFETGYVPQNGILNYSLVRKSRKKLGKCPVWEEEEEAAGQAENQTLEECVEDRRSRTDIKGTRTEGATEVLYL